MSVHVGIGRQQVYLILHDSIGVSKVSVLWVPKLLGLEQKLNRSDNCRQLQELLVCYSNKFWQRIIITDKT